MLTRLTSAMKFRTRASAAHQAESLWNYGAVVVGEGAEWRIVIETRKPDSLLAFLANHAPWAVWSRSEGP